MDVACAGDPRHSPAIGVSWLDQEVDGYRESGSAPAAMHFSTFERGFLLARADSRSDHLVSVGLRIAF